MIPSNAKSLWKLEDDYNGNEHWRALKYEQDSDGYRGTIYWSKSGDQTNTSMTVVIHSLEPAYDNSYRVYQDDHTGNPFKDGIEIATRQMAVSKASRKKRDEEKAKKERESQGSEIDEKRLKALDVLGRTPLAERVREMIQNGTSLDEGTLKEVRHQLYRRKRRDLTSLFKNASARALISSWFAEKEADHVI